MTAEIAILNTYGVSLAADSAVTISLGETDKKIYNSANKLFTLSKYRPVGIMIYSNSKFMDIEWEILIKEYRRKLGRGGFGTLFEYAEDFFKFLRTSEYIGDDQKESCLIRLVLTALNRIKGVLLGHIQQRISEKGKVQDSEVSEIVTIALQDVATRLSNIEDNKLYTLDKGYYASKAELVRHGISLVFEKIQLDELQIQKILDLVGLDIQKNDNFSGYSGVVIAGYGEKEIFPSLFSCQISGVTGDCLVVTKEDRNSVSYDNKAIIIPYAQSEMVSSFMEGIDPTFEKTIQKEVSLLFDGIKGIIQDEHKGKADELRGALQTALRDFKRKVYVDPIIGIVGSLQKSDLAEMAEALVNLTSFKRHVSAEAETVGGPTDVAIITKGDGFIWIKRKHYFDPKLNTHFFENYFREDEHE
jgi:hypothetical protein